MDHPTAASTLSTPCPSCSHAMAVHRLDRNRAGTTTIDVCVACRALWFDGFESLQLTPGATLALLKAIHDAEREPMRSMHSRLPCPRCSTTLVLTRDLQRSTRFSYFRCVRGHGRFTPFMQFLLEKNFVRPLPPAEIERLKRPFTRRENARTNASGTGLGLAIVERVARTHGGRLELLPNAKGGLLARLSLPLSS